MKQYIYTYAISEISTTLYAPFSINFLFPPPFSSAGVPSNCARPGMPYFFSRADRAKNAATLLVVMRLWPQACPIPGRASYSALKLISGPPEPQVASKEVSRPYA